MRAHQTTTRWKAWVRSHTPPCFFSSHASLGLTFLAPCACARLWGTVRCSVIWEMSGVARALSRPAEKRSPDSVNALCDFLRVFPCTSVLPPVHTTAVAERMTLVTAHKGGRGRNPSSCALFPAAARGCPGHLAHRCCHPSLCIVTGQVLYASLGYGDWEELGLSGVM